MLSKAITGLVTSGLLLAGQAAFADNYRNNPRYGYPNRGPDAGYDYARVVDVDPIIHRVRVSEPREECYTETQYEDTGSYRRSQPAAGQMILGGIIGAAIGNQIGRGDGRRAATVAGAVVGSAIGHDAAHRRSGRDDGYTEVRARDVERCTVRYEERYEERIDGYRVTYVYNGREFNTRLPYDPGDKIRVRVDVRPDA